jgi:hypothetical protein
MKTNIIHVLIIAIILVAGWSLFTVLQDFYNDDSSKYDNYSVIGKSKQYLPILSDDYSNQRNYPVYKPAAQLKTPETINNNRSLSKLSTDDDYSSFSVTGNSTYNNEVTNSSKQSVVNSVNPGQTTKTSFLGMSRVSRPFSKDIKDNAQRDLAVASTSGNISGSALSGSNGMMKAFGNDNDEGDAIEGGGGIENDDFYNDVPVGEGVYLLFFMAVLYVMYKMRRKLTFVLLRKSIR